MRCLSLAQALKAAGWRCIFLTSTETQKFAPVIEQNDFEIRAPDNVTQADLLVVDNYSLDITYEQSIRGKIKKIVVIDDLADRQHDCDILIDQTFGRLPDDYKSLVPDNCTICCGSDYTILRPQFPDSIDAAKTKRKELTRVHNILLSYGSTNPNSIIQKTLRAISGFTEWNLKIEVVVTSGTQELDQIEKLCADITKNTVHQANLFLNVTNMADYMLDADLAFGGGGTTSWERACLGLPTLLIELSANQKYVSENLDKLGALKRIGEVETIQEADIDKAFENMRDNKELLRKMSQSAFTVCDGKGAERLCKIMQKAIA